MPSGLTEMMEDIEDYSGQAEEVLSGLRNAVGNADEKLLKLQKELDHLERKTEDEQSYVTYDHRMSEGSDMDDDDISKYPEDALQNTTINDSILTSLRSSMSLDAAAASTKLFEIYPAPNTAGQQPNYFTPAAKLQGSEKITKTPSDESSTVQTITEKPQKDDVTEDRWSCLRRVLSEDKSAGSLARDELFKQILEATEKKPAPKQRPEIITRSVNSSVPMALSPTPIYKSSYDASFAERENFKERSNDAKPIKREENKFVVSELPESENNYRYFRPIQNMASSTKSDEDDSEMYKQAVEEANLENERLQKLLEDEKKKNDKLTDKVSSLENDLGEIRVKFELRNHEETTGKITAVVDEIQKAQKMRENAIMERLHIAARDRDDAMMRARAMQLKNLHNQKAEKLGHKDKADRTLMDLVGKIAMADSARIIEKYGNELVERMNNLKNAKARITEEEMAVVIKERDDAIAKCHTLRQELQNCIEELNNLKRSQNTSVNTTLKAKVLSTQEDRDQTQAKLYNAEEEIEMLRIYYSLHKSLTLAQDKDLAEKYNQHMEKIRTEAVKRAEQAKQVEAENHQMQEQLRAATKENHHIHNENAKINQEMQYLKEKCGKLERLVKVLRRKLVSQAQEAEVHS